MRIRYRWCALASFLFFWAPLAQAQPVDFNEFNVDSFPLTAGFPEANWLTTENTAQLDDDNPFASAENASANVFYGPFEALGTRITGQLSPGDGTRVDDDIVGFVLGYQPGDAEFVTGADYLLIDWKGLDQNFDFVDPASVPNIVHDATDGGLNPAGLAVSQVFGLPTADELWQHIDSEDGIDGGVIELQRAFTFGDTGYSREPDRVPYEFDINYTADRLTVFVDGVLQLDVEGSFNPGRFGLFTGWQGPTPIFSNFEVTDSIDLPESFPTATVDRDSGNLQLTNPSGDTSDFVSVSISSSAASLAPDAWLSISDNYDTPGSDSVDTDSWQIDEQASTSLIESEVSPVDGAQLLPGRSVDLGDVWIASRFEDIVVELELASGLKIPIVPEFIGNAGTPYSRSDLNTDGVIGLEDWQLFYPHTLKEFDEMTDIEAALMGDLDGDFDNDRDDFAIFKSDYDQANGAHAFSQMLAHAVPEPSAAILGLCGLGLLLGRRRTAVIFGLAFLCPVTQATAQSLNFTEFTLESFPRIADGFPEAAWDVTPTSATITGGANTSPSVLYSASNLQNTRIRGFVQPGTDDDVVGLVFGFQPGDASFGEDSADADYLVLDWKGIDQSFDFTDFSLAEEPFHDLTPGGFMPEGLALSRVTGLATMDELWQHVTLDQNPFGTVEEIARANTLGSTPYDRFQDPTPAYQFDIVWKEDQFILLVDGVLEILEAGDFGDGRFGLYTCCQSAGPSFSNFEVLDADSLDLATLVIRAEVDRSTGDVVISNGTPDAIEFDYYELRSASGSLDPAWQGLADQEVGTDSLPGLAWVEAGGSDSQALAELFLERDGSLGGATLSTGQSITLRGAYDPAVDGTDVQLSFRNLDGSVGAAFVEYVTSFSCDLNGDGTVDASDAGIMFGNWGSSGLGDCNNDGIVDAADAGIMFGEWTGDNANVPTSSVPEPHVPLLLLVAASAAVARRR